MLEVVFDLRNGHVSTIPNEPHSLKLKHYKKLTDSQQGLLKRYILRHKLDISLQQSVASSPENSAYVTDKLQHFVDESKQYRPTPFATLLGWLIILLMFAFPVFVAYHFSDWFQGNYVESWIESLSQLPLFQPDWLQHFLFGDYGVLSLGTYSLVWALPVVIMISLSVAVIDQSGLKGYVVWSIEPTMRAIGLNGSDIVPLLEGFGCNAAAITQAGHQCSACTKTECMSLISFGSSCSYQIGATLSVFSAAHQPWLFMPYLIMVFVGGIIHNKLWYKGKPSLSMNQFPPNHDIHWPYMKRLWVQMIDSIKMFVVQALPIFIGICIVVSFLALTPILNIISNIFTPILMLLDIPTQLSPGILFSMIRKDGMLLFNMDGGALIQSLSAWQLLLLVFFSSTFTACSVTITMMIRQLGWLEGFKITARQMITSLCCIVLLGTFTIAFTLFQ
ncbi:Fe2+ transport system protein B [Staphylococcus auricularis]|uniref:Ferrous iron transporter B n=1 Tax=Staphylococcus auricularis TaxID=29379 RepID=A0AAP8PN60_9STAP|nr:nucleoside recognition domain-containing protein [Staphylococcus auricularis]MCG7342180.1 ferrous iron transporter B [Staphylococcus auricularis]MDC6327080.1 ferrous iron transporter B [Staphylococcus auricularis]MDN4533288.1 ferrous iron transporter B [Staphylococcus auricularis]PNZ66313.1 ferrous iron transporter B [Staphylococcus auricularis]QPT06271.1 ferrous iron transporter B [Staphylococcus auricularis]